MNDKRYLGSKAHRCHQSGQAIVEIAVAAPLLLFLLFGLVDYGFALYDQQVLTNLSREGSSLASRGTDLANAAAAVVADSHPLNWAANQGCVIITAVTKDNNGALHVTGQAPQGCTTATPSKVVVGGAATLPDPALPPVGGTVYVTEVYYDYTVMTPVGRILFGNKSSRWLYDVAYF